MKLLSKSVKKRKSVSKSLVSDLESLYLTAFPPEERLDWDWLLKKADSGQADFVAYYDDSDFVGFTYSLMSDTVYYLLFLAVVEDKHSQGYGSAILAKVAQQAGSRIRVLVIEPSDQAASNYGQRLRRLAFYQSNGYHLTPHYYYEGPEVYQVMASQTRLPLADFTNLAKLIEQTGVEIGVD
ncbi:GNAT family N-acetyltransferase [Streptococcus tangpeifui]|uniref:GNAT family N-acetyltransferase n=1 Tax=Streptococcus tangpeifui TaxID=2709400 RepID=UPI0013EB16F6|nr:MULTISPECIES: GNAT family N-acetyltransferase [unclassified Streptococcus]